jgi:magnesium chelatase family protein
VIFKISATRVTRLPTPQAGHARFRKDHPVMTTPETLPWAPDTGHARGAAVTGTDGHLLTVRATISNGLDSFTITGVHDTAGTLRDRVRAAVVNSGLSWPGRAITVTVTPPGLPGCGLDLPVAIAILTAAGVIPAGTTVPCVLIAELGLDGSLRPARAVLPAVTAAARAGTTIAIVAPGNTAEAVLAPGISAVGCPGLRGLLTWLRARPSPQPPCAPAEPGCADSEVAARLAASPPLLLALQASAAGGHHLSLTGPRHARIAGLAQGIHMLLPPLTTSEAAEVTAIHSTAGLLQPGSELLTEPPWRSPHHTITLPGMLGGGTGIVSPGEAALAHHGVLFLDQAPEFGRGILTALRQPLTCGQVTISRGAIITRFPARFTLITTMTPCPCGTGPGCTCSPLQARRYTARLTSDLGRYFSLRLTVTGENPPGRAEPDPHLWAARVADARDRARHRLRDTNWQRNADIPAPELTRHWQPGTRAIASLTRAVDLGQVSRPAAAQVIRLAWTLADLAGQPKPGPDEIQHALTLQLGTTC